MDNFRSYASAALEPVTDGLTVVEGANGEGKTNLLEALGYLATLRSFRGAPGEALVAEDAEQAVVRAEGMRESRRLLVEAEINRRGRDRIRVNRQTLSKRAELAEAFQVTVFAPEDLVLIKGGPGERRGYLDELLAGLHPRHAAAQADLERVLKQRNALLKQVQGSRRLEGDTALTLEVWDHKMSEAGEALVRARRALCEALVEVVGAAYGALAAAAPRQERTHIGIAYRGSWEGSLADALQAARPDDLRRGVSTVGPHRDEVELTIGGTPARTHASQGEQRSLALALRLGGHRLATQRIGSAPVLLLDDVFSELDPHRSRALLAALPAGQAVLTTASGVPEGADPGLIVRIEHGRLVA